MNSEIPATPESENTNFEPLESLDKLQSDESPRELTSDAVKDIWSEENTNSTKRDSLSAANQNKSDSKEQAVESEVVSDFSSSTFTPTPSEAVNSSSKETAQTTEESSSEPELFVDRWLDEPEILSTSDDAKPGTSSEIAEIEELKQQKADLQQEITALKTQQEQLRSQQIQVLQSSLIQMIEEGTKELQERKTALRIEIEKLERRKDRINQEMRSNFAGSSKELAIRVQGFKEYLVGSLQDLTSAASKLELAPEALPRNRERISEEPRRKSRDKDRDRDRDRGRDSNRSRERESRRGSEAGRDRGNAERLNTQFSEPTFADQSRRIRQLLDKYCNSPDYYGSPWQLRRTFEASQAKKVQEWFFGQGGRGAVDSTGSRLQNILIASAAISILYSIHGDRCRILVLTDTPENLGEWRKGLQDCLGISRSNFGANRGVTLFDSPDVLVQRANRLIADKLLPIIIVDETEELLNLSVLKYPIWLAFASTNKSASSNYLY